MNCEFNAANPGIEPDDFDYAPIEEPNETLAA